MTRTRLLVALALAAAFTIGLLAPAPSDGWLRDCATTPGCAVGPPGQDRPEPPTPLTGRP